MTYYIDPREISSFETLQLTRIVELIDALRTPASSYQQFEVALHNQETKKYRLKMKSESDFVQSVPSLNKIVAKFPAHVYFRPNNSSIILVDDISWSTIEQMFDDRFEPSVVVETSPKNYQAWIRISDRFISNEIASKAARYFADKYQGDKGCCHYRHVGRLIGFPNFKPQYMKDNKYPFVRLAHAENCLAYQGKQLLESLSMTLSVSLYKNNQAQRTKKPSIYEEETVMTFKEIRNFQSYVNRSSKEQCMQKAQSCYQWMIENKKGSGTNWKKHLSEIDFAVVCKLVHSGYPYEYIKEAMEKYSFDLQQRKKNHVQDYTLRTISKAAKAVLKSYQAKAK